MSYHDQNNGERGVEHQPIDTMTLAYNRATDHMDIGGKCNSLDLMLDMLARATRVIENRWRRERAIELQQELAQMARDNAIATHLRGGGGRA